MNSIMNNHGQLVSAYHKMNVFKTQVLQITYGTHAKRIVLASLIMDQSLNALGKNVVNMLINYIELKNTNQIFILISIAC